MTPSSGRKALRWLAAAAWDLRVVTAVLFGSAALIFQLAYWIAAVDAAWPGNSLPVGWVNLNVGVAVSGAVEFFPWPHTLLPEPFYHVPRAPDYYVAWLILSKVYLLVTAAATLGFAALGYLVGGRVQKRKGRKEPPASWRELLTRLAASRKDVRVRTAVVFALVILAVQSAYWIAAIDNGVYFYQGIPNIDCNARLLPWPENPAPSELGCIPYPPEYYIAWAIGRGFFIPLTAYVTLAFGWLGWLVGRGIGKLRAIRGEGKERRGSP